MFVSVVLEYVCYLEGQKKMTSFFVLHIEERYQPGEISPNTSVLPALILKKERKKKKKTPYPPLWALRQMEKLWC